MVESEVYDVGIVGGGVAGFSCALYAGRFNLNTILITEMRGGTIITTDEVSNYPGFAKISGQELAQKIEAHALDYNVKIIDALVESATKLGNMKDGCFELKTDSKSEIKCRTLVLATGTKRNKLNVPREEELSGKGVHYCALCDGALYRNKKVVVVGSGDAAFKEALLISNYAREVIILARENEKHAEPINLRKVEKTSNIKIVNNCCVKEIFGKEKVSGIAIEDKEGKLSRLETDAVFVEIGSSPKNELAKLLGIRLNDKEYIKVEKDCSTSMPGVFACGDITDSNFKQAIVSASQGSQAAYSAYRYLFSHTISCFSD